MEQPASWITSGVKNCKNLSHLHITSPGNLSVMNFPSNLTDLNIDVSDFDLEFIKSLPDTLQNLTIESSNVFYFVFYFVLHFIVIYFWLILYQ